MHIRRDRVVYLRRRINSSKPADSTLIIPNNWTYLAHASDPVLRRYISYHPVIAQMAVDVKVIISRFIITSIDQNSFGESFYKYCFRYPM